MYVDAPSLFYRHVRIRLVYRRNKLEFEHLYKNHEDQPVEVKEKASSMFDTILGLGEQVGNDQMILDCLHISTTCISFLYIRSGGANEM